MRWDEMERRGLQLKRRAGQSVSTGGLSGHGSGQQPRPAAGSSAFPARRQILTFYAPGLFISLIMSRANWTFQSVGNWQYFLFIQQLTCQAQSKVLEIDKGKGLILSLEAEVFFHRVLHSVNIRALLNLTPSAKIHSMQGHIHKFWLDISFASGLVTVKA